MLFLYLYRLRGNCRQQFFLHAGSLKLPPAKTEMFLISRAIRRKEFYVILGALRRKRWLDEEDKDRPSGAGNGWYRRI